jgi:hypothetical protein
MTSIVTCNSLKITQGFMKSPGFCPSPESELDAYFHLEPVIKSISLIEQKGIKSSLFDGFVTPSSIIE